MSELGMRWLRTPDATAFITPTNFIASDSGDRPASATVAASPSSWANPAEKLAAGSGRPSTSVAPG